MLKLHSNIYMYIANVKGWCTIGPMFHYGHTRGFNPLMAQLLVVSFESPSNTFSWDCEDA